MGLSRVAVLERLSDSVMTKMKQVEKRSPNSNKTELASKLFTIILYMACLIYGRLSIKIIS